LSTAPRPQSTGSNGPFLVPKRPEAPHARSPLALWHLLSLDAPTVAAIWVLFVAWCAGTRLSLLDPIAMFLAVWILYAADRLLDAKPLSHRASVPGLEERHRFHYAHRTRFMTAMLAAVLPLTWLLHRTNDAALHLYILLACLLSGWLLLVHARPGLSASAHRLPKELAVGVFFPAAVFIPTVARAPWLRSSLLPVALAFAAICTLNCLFLFAWEHPHRQGHAHATTRWGSRRLVPVGVTVAVLSTTAWGLAWLVPVSAARYTAALPHGAAAFCACSLSAILLLLLHAFRHRLAPTNLRALADLVLLTPVPVYLAAAVHR
jgi:hypothetical protein